MENKPLLYLVIPCYNEEKMLLITIRKLEEKLNALIEKNLISEFSQALYIDDGSKDKTWSILEKAKEKYDHIKAIKLSHNAGHQNALFCGLMKAKENCDIAISLDCDLQDDINVLEEFIDKYQKGSDVIYGVRNNRQTDTLFKKSTAQAYYKFMNFLGVKLVYNHADYRLLSKKALEALSEYKEQNLFLRGIIPLLGYKNDIVYYKRQARLVGESKYPLSKMISFALNGITSFSVKPLKIISNIGIILSICSIAGLIYALISFFLGIAVAGWTAIISSIYLLGGIQLFFLGIVASYIGRIYQEVKARPRYNVEKEI